MEPPSLQRLIENGDVVQCQGNQNAQIVFLDDTNHLDQTQSSIRDKIFNCLKGKMNVRLREAVDSGTLSVSDNVYESGWDNMLLHQESKKALQQWFKLRKSLNDAFGDDREIVRITKEIKATKNTIREKAHLRTQSMWQSINKYLDLFPEAKIFIDAGSGHNHEEWLKDRLQKKNYRYCIVTPKETVVPDLCAEFLKYYSDSSQIPIKGNDIADRISAVS